MVALIIVALLRRSLTPVLRVAIREQMKGEPQVEIDKRIATLSSVIYRTVLFVAATVVLITVVTEFGINAAALIAGFGLVGLAVGFGAQDLVKDIINGMFILFENQYAKGDIVTIGGLTGVVEEINLRRTILRDLDGVVHSIGHSQVEVTSNWTKSYSRVNLNVGVSYDSNLDHVIAVINRVGEEMAHDPDWENRILTPPHVLRVDNFGDSSIDIKIIGDTAPIEQWSIMGELRLRLKKAFDAEGIEIPFPQRTVHMANAASSDGRFDTHGEAVQTGGGRADDVRMGEGADGD